MRFKRIKKEIHNQIHIARRYGTRKQAIDYCKKHQLFEKNGEKNIQGERTDLLKIRDQIKQDVTQKEILETYKLNSSQLRVID
jgi:uncharacterized protein